MNCLLILPQELTSPGEATLTGERLRHAIKGHELKAGVRVRAALLGGKRGYATVTGCSDTAMQLSVDLSEEPLPRCNQIWIVALCRPQTAKKIIQAAATLGVRALYFVRAAQSVKSYGDSPVLSQQGLWSETLKGLEQGGDSIAPEIFIQPLFRPFVEERLPQVLAAEESPLCLVADTRASATLVEHPKHAQSCIIAIGPESGWNEHEGTQFRALGFRSVSLGPRFLRVDTAALYLSAQIEAFRPTSEN